MIGANCGQGIASYVEVCRQLHAATDLPIWIKANAGMPTVEGVHVTYTTTADEFASYGPATLQELASSWRALDDHPHVHQFIDMHDVGDTMLMAGFAQPVVDAETIRMEYREFRALLDDLKNTGASNVDLGRRRGLTTPAKLRAVESRYRELGFENDRFIASYEIVYGHAWML